ncbi:hypothetical protein BD413DRAFT_13964 [Trametes elegans]|nr:hypothetical protein BD413DRAFT_13964 [Trametes elegans]
MAVTLLVFVHRRSLSFTHDALGLVQWSEDKLRFKHHGFILRSGSPVLSGGIRRKQLRNRGCGHILVRHAPQHGQRDTARVAVTKEHCLTTLFVQPLPHGSMALLGHGLDLIAVRYEAV